VSDADGDRATADWRRFSALPRMVNHWDRPGWDSGRSAYYWYLTFDSPALSMLTQKCQEQFDRLGLDLVETDWLHLSLIRLAWSDEISRDYAERAAEEANCQLQEISGFTLWVGPLAGSAGAIRFSVEPWEPIKTVRETLARLSPGADRIAVPKPFLPHISIAYNNHDRLARPVIDVAAEARLLPKVAVDVAEVALVEVRRVGRAYKWKTVRQVPLGNPSPVGRAGRPGSC
jgi:2'-5' RNA ligase